MTSTLAPGGRPGPVTRRALSPIHVFAILGGAILVANLLIVLTWVTGPTFERVPAGSELPPEWMRAVLNVTQIVLPAAALVVMYRCIVRPWRRDRVVTLDGSLCLAGLVVSIWDGASSAMQPWFGYNSYLLNYGNPLGEVPGWLSLNEPGHALAWSFPVIPALYVVVFPVVGRFGSWVLRSIEGRFPALHPTGVLALCVAVMVVAELLFEGVIFLPLGFWTYAGGHEPALFAGHYFQLPVNELLHVTIIFTAVAYLAHHVNDHGETVVERGASRLPGSPAVIAGSRVLAMVAALHVITFASYHLPQVVWGLNSPTWIDDVRDRSYFLNQCGPDIDRACPGPGVPVPRPGSGYVNWDGEFVLPNGD